MQNLIEFFHEMGIKILLYVFGFLLLLVPIVTEIKKDQKFTKWGKVFILSAVLTLIFQVLDERNNSIVSDKLDDKIDTLNLANQKIDTLNIKVESLKDSIFLFKQIISSFESIKKQDIELKEKKFLRERPVFALNSTQIIRNIKSDSEYSVKFEFKNFGEQPATNLVGKIYLLYREQLVDQDFSISKSDVFPNGIGFDYTHDLPVNPELFPIQYTTYFYFNMTYSDLTIDHDYPPYEVIVKLNPFEKGKYSRELSFCSNEEIVEVLRKIENLK